MPPPDAPTPDDFDARYAARERQSDRARKIGAAAVALATLGVVVWVARHEAYDVPNRPLPDLKVAGLDGSEIGLRSLEGRAAVIALWVPG